MEQRKVWVFFYGSYINMKVLKDIGFEPEEYEVARLDGYDIDINPISNLYVSDKECVYGIVVKATHNDLKLLYNHAETKLGGLYLPEPVLVSTEEGNWRTALCYIANSIESKQPTEKYINTITESAKEYKFPTWYIQKIEKFKQSHNLKKPINAIKFPASFNHHT